MDPKGELTRPRVAVLVSFLFSFFPPSDARAQDEILKAAVMKYGLNQWSRISSLLVRKSAKQCKARWYEWLDPSIRKVSLVFEGTKEDTTSEWPKEGRSWLTSISESYLAFMRHLLERFDENGTNESQVEWTREEDEKLLHLAKLMPTQWRTIAPIVGRTPAQCLERYEHLLDAATRTQEEYDEKEDPRRLRPGEIDPQPETKPARPDAMDMDEDEKEMLAEARARLANTKGKKAKRKAREKQLEEAKRLARLQKERELKAAGLYTGDKKRKKELDYNAEIVFQKKPPPGFYDVMEEVERSKQEPEFKPRTVEEIEGRRRDDIEQALRKSDISRQKIRERHDAPGFIAHQLEMNEVGVSRKRSKLSLPAPQVTDVELNEIARLGKERGEGIAEEGEAGTSATLQLGGVAETPRTTQNHTTASRTDSQRRAGLMMEAQNLALLQSGQTPLAGGQNPVLHPSDFHGATPRYTVDATPNHLMTPLLGSKPGLTTGETSRGMRGEATPQRTAAFSEVAPRVHSNALSSELSSDLLNLPLPKNQYQVLVQELEPRKTENKDFVEDMSDVLARQQAANAAAESTLLRMRTVACQRGLPRPNLPLHQPTVEDSQLQSRAAQMIHREMSRLVRHDEVGHPLGVISSKLSCDLSVESEFAEDEIDAAKHLIEEESRNSMSQSTGTTEGEGMLESTKFIDENFMWSDSRKMFVERARLEEAQKLSLLQEQWCELERERLTLQAAASDLTKEVDSKLAAPMKRFQRALQQSRKLCGDLDAATVELSCFQVLQDNEKIAAPARLIELRETLEDKRQKEKQLQALYADLIEMQGTLA